MARHPSITQAMVNDACGKLLELEQTPTIKRVRSIIGKGSETTIGRMLKLYFQEKEKESIFSKYEINISEDVILQFKKTLIESQKELVERDVKFQNKINSLNKQIEDLIVENTDYSDRVEELTSLLNTKERRHEAMELKLRSLEQELQEEKKRSEKLNSLKEENIKLSTRLEVAKEQIEELKN